MNQPVTAADRRDREVVARRPADPGLFLALAPMDGVTCAVYRGLITDLGTRRGAGISLCVSEFVRVTRGAVPTHVIRRHCPEVDHGGRTRAGVPVFVQILGGCPESMAATARRAAELGAPGIDINFGCPAKKVNNHDGGAAILREPDRVERIVRATRDAVPPDIPVTVKIRVGWDSSETLEQIALAAERGGGDWLTIHARTRTQLYKPPVRWRALARACAAVRAMPVIANGDLFAPRDLHDCAAVSDCRAFMIGRGAMGEPALFERARGWRDEPTALPELAAILLEYYARLVAAGRPERRALCRVKQWLRMAAAVRPEFTDVFNTVKVLQSWEQAGPALAAIADGHVQSIMFDRAG